MHVVFIGLTLSSSWGNGHATTYRALLRGLHCNGHKTTFLEQDTPYYAAHRDLANPEYADLEFYSGFDELRTLFRGVVKDADAVIVGSYVQSGAQIVDWVRAEAKGLVCFYDIDTPVTMAALRGGETRYLRLDQIPAFDIYLSFTGGPLLRRIERDFGARRAAALYCAVDTEFYRPVTHEKRWRLGYLGTYSEDRQAALEGLVVGVARMRPADRFAVAGARYPEDLEWPGNIDRVEHIPPRDHPAFYSKQLFTLNLTRRDMIAQGWSPSVRLFEAAACGAPIISDRWNGLHSIFPEGEAILIAECIGDVLDHLELDQTSRTGIADAARQIVNDSHSAQQRALELERYLAERAAAAPELLEAAS